MARKTCSKLSFISLDQQHEYQSISMQCSISGVHNVKNKKYNTSYFLHNYLFGLLSIIYNIANVSYFTFPMPTHSLAVYVLY